MKQNYGWAGGRGGVGGGWVVVVGGTGVGALVGGGWADLVKGADGVGLGEGAEGVKDALLDVLALERALRGAKMSANECPPYDRLQEDGYCLLVSGAGVAGVAVGRAPTQIGELQSDVTTE